MKRIKKSEVEEIPKRFINNTLFYKIGRKSGRRWWGADGWRDGGTGVSVFRNWVGTAISRKGEWNPPYNNVFL